MAANSSDPSVPSGKRGGTRKAATFDQARVVRRYLSAVENARPGRGTKRTADAIANRITKVDEMLVSADPLTRVHLTQERIELHAEHVRVTNGGSGDQSQFERDFVRVARSYGDRSGITYAAWRQVGVDATVLERAGVHKAEKKPPPAAVRAAQEAAEAQVPKPSASEPVPAEETKGPEESSEPKEPKARTADAQAAAPTPAEVDAPVTTAEEPTEAVSMDELALAALLTDASVGASPVNSASQPRLGDDLGSAGNDAPPPPRRTLRAGPNEGNGKA